MQSRIGPYRVGPHGLLQPIADAIKLMMKEDVVPTAADRTVYNLAPIVFVLPCMLIFATIPFAPGLGVADLNIGILFFLAISAMEIVGLFMAGWGSNNKYALLSAMRAVNQIISYDLPFIFCRAHAGAARRVAEAVGHCRGAERSLVRLLSGDRAAGIHRLHRLDGGGRESRAVRHSRSRVGARRRLPRRVFGHEVRADSARRVRARDRRVVPRRAAVSRRVGRTGTRMARTRLVPAEGDVRVPAHHVGAMELRPHSRRSDPCAVVEGAAAVDPAAAHRHGARRGLEDPGA